MADDPTTTGAEPITGDEIFALNFSESIAGRTVVRRVGGKIRVELYFPETLLDAPPGIVLTLPADPFKSEEQLKAWAFNIAHSFRASMYLAFRNEMAPLLFEQAYEQLQALGLPIDTREVLKTVHRIRNMNAAPFITGKIAGRSAKWQAEELRDEITRALSELKPRERNYDGVAEVLKQWHGERAPDSGGALRQQVIRLGLDWKSLKGATIRRKTASISYEIKT